jgi:hypothetical protein
MSSTKIDVPAQTFKLGQDPTLSPEGLHISGVDQGITKWSFTASANDEA